MNKRIRVLLFGEAVTLAHIVRPRVLAESLDTSNYDVLLACDTHLPIALQDLKIAHKKISSRTPEEFMAILKNGGILFDREILSRYCEEEDRIIAEWKPDIVVGDLRPSLSVSAARYGIPLITLTNAYWSTYSMDQSWPGPSLEFLKKLHINGAAAKPFLFIMEKLFTGALPKILAAQGKGIDVLRAEKQLPPYPSYKDGFIYGDMTLYCDLPSVVQTNPLPYTHRFIGPVEWSPDASLPSWWDTLPSDKEVVFVNLGSSGDPQMLPRVLRAVKDSNAIAVVATAGRAAITEEKSWVYSAPFLPGEEILKRASVLICNGGSPSAYQALHLGKPVIGIASNMDQLLFSRELERSKAGVFLRADSASVGSIHNAIGKCMSDRTLLRKVQQVRTESNRYRATEIFSNIINEIVSTRSSYGRVHNM